MDKIIIHGLQVYAYHGVNPEEKRDGQPFLFDITAGYDTRLAGRTDRVEDTVSYAKMAKRIKAVATAEKYDLLERVAAVVAETLLREFPLECVTVCVRKPRAPITAAFDWVGVEITRTREVLV